MTLEEAAPILAPAVDNGVCPEDPRVIVRVNEACDAINRLGVWVGSMAEHLVCTLSTEKVFTLPRQLENVIEVTQLTPSRDIGQGWFEVLAPSTYVDPEQTFDEVLIDRGEVPLFQDLVGAATIRIYSDLPEDAGKSVWLEGVNDNVPVTSEDDGSYISGERIAVAESIGGYTDGTQTFTKVTRVRKSATVGVIRIYARPTNGDPQYQVGQMEPDETEARYRRYYYPAMTLPNSGPAQLRVTGLRRFIPLRRVTDRLPFDVRAIKLMLLAIAKEEQNLPQEAQGYQTQALTELQRQTQRYLLDPKQGMLRKAQYQADETNYGPRTFGGMRARLALEVPMALKLGRSQLGRCINAAERRLIESGKWRGTKRTVIMEDDDTAIADGIVTLPADCEAILEAALDERPIQVRDQFYEFNPNGPGIFTSSTAIAFEVLIDRDENASGRRQYMLSTRREPPYTLRLRCKARHVPKSDPTTAMQIVNFEAIKEEVMSLMLEGFLPPAQRDLQQAGAHHAKALSLLESENQEYLSGIPSRPMVEHLHSGGSIPTLF